MATSVGRRLWREGSTLLFYSRRCSKITVRPTTPNRYFSLSKCLASRFYTKKHEWVSVESGTGTIGISDHAQDQLGEIVYVELPELGVSLEAEDVAGCVESVKAASEIYSPISGEVAEVNEALVDQPGLVNSSPLSEGWLYKLKLAAGASTDNLMDEKAYKEYVGSLEN